jgi:hypothetical protein
MKAEAILEKKLLIIGRETLQHLGTMYLNCQKSKGKRKIIKVARGEKKVYYLKE